MAERDVIIKISARNLTQKEFDAARKQLDDLGKKAGLTNSGFSQMGKGFQGAAKDLASFNPAAAKASSLLGGFGPAGIAAAAGIGATVGAVALGVSHVVNLGDQMVRLSDRTGLSTDLLQELKFASDQLGVPFETAANAVSKLQVNLGKTTPAKETTDALKEIGLSLEELRAMAPEEQFQAVTASLAEMKNQTEQAAAAQALFGRGGIELLPLIRGNYAELAQAARDLGIVLDDDLLNAGERLGDQWQVLHEVGKALLSQVVAPLIEDLGRLTASMIEFVKEGEKLGKEKDRTVEFLNLRNRFVRAGLSPEDAEREARSAQAQLDMLRQREEELKKTKRTTDDVGDSTERLAKLEESRTRVLRELNRMQSEGARVMAELAFQQQVLSDALAEFPAAAGEIPGLTTLEGTPFSNEIAIVTREWKLGVGEVKEETDDLVTAQNNYNEALQGANALAQLIGGNIGQLLGQTLAAGAALSNLGNIGGLGGAFKAGKGEATGFLGLLGGIGGVAGAVGPFVGLGVSLVNALKGMFGRNAQDVAKDVGRNIGASISDGLAEQILRSGLNEQFFLKEIFMEGGLSPDQLAREVGDLFSFFERGEISKQSLIGELKETLPILVQHLKDLGPAGEAEIARITAAAERFGVSIAEIDQLIQGTFSPATVEEMAAAFGLTNDQIRAMAEELGLNVQTNLERVAASVGLTAEEFQNLGAALEERFGIPAEQLEAFLKSSGLSAAELAEKLGVDVGEGAQAAADAQELANQRLGVGVELAGALADNLERAANASSRIGFSGLDSFTAQHGIDRIFSRPTLGLFGEAGPEHVKITPLGGGGGGGFGGVTMHFTVNVAGGAGGVTDAQIQDLIRQLRNNMKGAADELAATLKGRM